MNNGPIQIRTTNYIYLEFHGYNPNTGGNSHKFWEAEKIGFDVFVRWGRVGSTGQTQVKTFANPAAAFDFMEDKYYEKSAKGYQLVSREKASLPVDPQPFIEDLIALREELA